MTAKKPFNRKKYGWPIRVLAALITLASGCLTSHPANASSVTDRMALWRAGAFKGTVIELRAVNKEVDAEGFLGPAGTHVGPVYTQQNFNDMAEAGINLVVISHPGIYRVDPPYKLDNAFAHSLDRLLDMALAADLFAVIEPRTGPGRSEFTHYLEEIGTWFGEAQLNDTIWREQAARQRWAEMLRVTAERYRHHRALAGLVTMALPNGNITGADALNHPVMEPDPVRFNSDFAGRREDWNRLQPDIIRAIRRINQDVPVILVPGNGGDPAWLPFMEVSPDDRLVIGLNWVDPPAGSQLSETLLADVKALYPHIPMAALRAWVRRDRPDAVAVMRSYLNLFARRDMGFAAGLWQSDWPPYAEDRHRYAFRFGPDPQSRRPVRAAPLATLYRSYWAGSPPRPSQLTRNFR